MRKILLAVLISVFVFSGNASALTWQNGGGGGDGLVGGLPVDTADAGDDGAYLVVDWSNSKIDYGTPAGGGDMTQAVWDGDTDGFIDADAGGTDINTSASTGVPSISTGTWSVAATLTHELGGLEADVSGYTNGLFGVIADTTTDIDTAAELETAAGLGAFFNEYADDADAAAMIATLGVSSAATIAANYQPLDADLTSIAALGSAADKIAYTTALATWAETPLTSFGRSIIDDADEATFKQTVNLEIGTDVQAFHAYLADVAGITAAQGDVIYFDGSDWVNLGYGTSGYYLKTQGVGANPTWDAPPGGGDVTAVGNCLSGDCFTDGHAGDASLVFEVTDNAFETTLIASEPEQDNTVTIPDGTGTIVLGPADFAADNILIKTNYAAGTESLTQATGVIVDDSNNMSSIGTISAGSITSSGSFIIGAADVNQTELEILDGATTDTADMNIIDGISDSGDLTAAELLYVDGVTSAIQTQLDVRALESVVGTSLNANDLVNSATVLELVAQIPHLDETEEISAAWEVQDDTSFAFGNGADITLSWDTDISNNDSDFTTALTGEGLVIEGANAAADIKVVINNTDATYGATLYVENIVYSGEITADNTDQSYWNFVSGSGTPAGAGTNSIYVDTNNWKIEEAGVTKELLDNASSISMDAAATTVDFSATTNFLIPTTADASSEIGVNDSTDILAVGVQDGAGAWISFDFTGVDGNDTYVMAWDEANNKFTAQAQAGGGGDTSWDDLNDPDAGTAASFAMDGAGETTTFTMSADNTEWLFDFTAAFTVANSPDLFKIIQQTGDAEAVTLVTILAADSDVIPLEVGGGSNVWTVTQAGRLGAAGTADITVPSIDDYLVGSTSLNDLDMAFTVSQTFAAGIDVSGSAGITLENDETITNTVDGTITLSGNLATAASAEPEILITDSTTSGEAKIDVTDAAGPDVTMELLIDIGGTLTPYLHLDGVNQNAEIGHTGATGVTIISDGGADTMTLGNNTDLDFGITFDSDTDDATINWDEANSEMEFDAPNYRFGANADENIVIVLDADTNDATITYDEDNDEIETASNIIVTGHVDSGTLFIETTTDVDVTVAGSSRMHINNHASAINYTLPADPETAGGDSKTFCFRNRQAQVITITPAAGDVIELDGTDASAAEAIVSTGAVGEFMCLMGFDDAATDRWLSMGYSGTWAEATP